MAGIAAFWDRIADRYERNPVSDEAAYQEKLARTRKYFRPDMDLLEVGCGTGSTAIVHAPHVRSIDAVDISANMLDICRRKAEAAGIANISFRQGNVEEMALEPARYDMVLALSLLHLVSDRDAVLARLYATLRPGGYLVSSTTCIGDVLPVLGYVAPLGRALGLLPLLRSFTEPQLLDSIGRAGFVIEDHWTPGKRKAVFVIAQKPA